MQACLPDCDIGEHYQPFDKFRIVCCYYKNIVIISESGKGGGIIEKVVNPDISCFFNSLYFFR